MKKLTTYLKIRIQLLVSRRKKLTHPAYGLNFGMKPGPYFMDSSASSGYPKLGIFLLLHRAYEHCTCEIVRYYLRPLYLTCNIYQQVHAIRADHTNRNRGEKPESVPRVLERVGHCQDSAAHAPLDQMQERFQIPVEIYQSVRVRLKLKKVHFYDVGRLSILLSYGS
jgi:hypothetical protein